MPQKKKKRPKKRKFKTVTFKLSERQKKSLDKYSKARNTTPLKLIKRAIETFTSLQDDMLAPKEQISENQLDLFIEAQAMDAINKSADGNKADGEIGNEEGQNKDQ